MDLEFLISVRESVGVVPGCFLVVFFPLFAARQIIGKCGAFFVCSSLLL